MPKLSEPDLKKQLQDKEPGPLYLLEGDEKLILSRAARRLINMAADSGFPEFNQNEFSGQIEIERLIDAAVALPFMAAHKCVAISDLNIEELPSAELEKLLELMDDLPDTTTLVFYYPTLEVKKAAKWKKFRDKAESKGFVVGFDRREAPELRKTLSSAAGKQGCAFSRAALDRLLEYAGNDLKLLLSETDKLCAYALSQSSVASPEITPNMVEALTPKSTDTTAFMMVNALIAEDYQRAYALLNSLFYQNEDPIYILGAVSSAYVDIFRVKSALESGLTSEGPMEYSADYKGKAFRLRNAERSGRKISDLALQDSLKLLLEADLALKGSKLDARLVLEGLIAKLLTVRSGAYNKVS